MFLHKTNEMDFKTRLNSKTPMRITYKRRLSRRFTTRLNIRLVIGGKKIRIIKSLNDHNLFSAN